MYSKEESQRYISGAGIVVFPANAMTIQSRKPHCHTSRVHTPIILPTPARRREQRQDPDSQQNGETMSV